MSISQLLMLAGGLVFLLLIAAVALSGPNAGKEAARRMQAVRFRHSDSSLDRVEAQFRKAVAQRKPKTHQIAGSESRIVALQLRLNRTGKGWTLAQYTQSSIGLGVVVAILVFLKSGAPLLGLGVGVLVGAALPHMVVGWHIKRRYTQFTSKFPDAIELLVRGLRSGLPVTETLVVVGQEVPGPVGQEFKLITERVRIGRAMDDALQDSADRLNMAEFSFFCITLAIQRETGGNLAETLANLADVLRKRAQMKLKVKAMSSEAKASAYIIGVLPFMVFGMIEMTDPDYLKGFWEGGLLTVVGLGGLCWMGIGAFIMAQMINFEI